MENDRRQWWSLLGREGAEGEGVKKGVINSILNTRFYVYCSLLEDLCTGSVLTKKNSKQASNENVGKNSWRYVLANTGKQIVLPHHKESTLNR